MALDYQELYKVEGSTSLGAYGFKLLVAIRPRHEEGAEPINVDLNHERVRYATYDAETAIKEAVMRTMVEQMPSQIARGVRCKEEMMSCFADHEPIYVEDIPNGYCKYYCCSMLMWHNVTTRVGKITIGPRKSVINIDWSGAKGTKKAEELFPNESTTMGDRYIHAWTVEKARAYVSAIITGVPLSTQQNATVST